MYLCIHPCINKLPFKNVKLLACKPYENKQQAVSGAWAILFQLTM